VRELGEGGFGIVYLAEQLEPLKRKVALKVIKPGMDSRQIISRFEAERQTLARLSHPNIAAVLDAGTTTDGRPFFVMEWVDGMPMTRYCDDHQLNVRQRLELFIPVCLAVQHAHQKAILHRDLKPSNILVMKVDGRPIPKVIDFGIAKVLDSSEERDFQGSLLNTQEGMVLGTPQYMSPEQAGASLNLDPRSDVYALGTILFELLVGEPPLSTVDLKNVALHEICRMVREKEAPRPSARVARLAPPTATQAARLRGKETGQKLTREIHGDLDWIILKALAKEREHRYGSAAELAADLKRYLGFEPVMAGPPSVWYHIRKFGRRHRLAIGVTTAVIILLLAWGQAQWQSGAAQGEVLTLTDRIHRLEAALSRLAETEQMLMRTVDPLSSASARQLALALLEADLNLPAGMLARDLPALAQDLYQRPETTLLTRAQAAFALGRMQESEALFLNSAQNDEQVFEAALEMTERLRANRQQALEGAALSALSRHDYLRAVQHYHEALKIAEKAIHRNSLTEARLGWDIAYALDLSGQYAESVTWNKKVYEALSAQLGSDHVETLQVQHNLATALRSAGRFKEAQQAFHIVIAARARVLGMDDPATLNSRNNLASTLDRLGRYAEAEAELRAVLKAYAKQAGAEDERSLRSLANLAGVLLAQDKNGDAEQPGKQAWLGLQHLLGAEHPDTLQAGVNYAYTLNRLGRHSESEALCRTIVAAMKKVLGADHPDTLNALNNLAETLQAQERWQEAVAGHASTLETREKVFGETHRDVMESCYHLAESLAGCGRQKEALLLAQRCFDGRQKLLGTAHPDTHRAADLIQRLADQR
jgi:non-specific serine/threonine protein kinase/serine/threonine-protein kinase